MTLNELQNRLDELSKKQEMFAKEIQFLSQQIKQFSVNEGVQTEFQEEKVTEDITEFSTPKIVENENLTKEFHLKEAKENTSEKINQPFIFTKPKKERKPSDLEKIIGESWINKIGILVLIIGVFLGAKYSIENDLINPLTRIILGYLSGIGLLGFGIKLKAKYESYSAVLVSGAMAIFYFITFFAYDFYHLIPQILTFILMVVFTIFTVLSALNYNKPVIAHIGLVGAYAIPFLLSSGSGRADILFGYMTIINLGILFISIKKYWKSLHYVAFSFTWLIFGSWLFLQYDSQWQQSLAFIFALIFFLQFYAVVLINRILEKQIVSIADIILVLLNAFIFFAMGLYIVNDKGFASEFSLSLFTIFNAIIHFVVAYIIRKQKLGNTTIFYLVIGLVFSFITIAIPIQLNGNWVTLLWAALSAVLFWIGRTRQIVVYERIALVIAFLSFVSFLDDMKSTSIETAFFNWLFMTTILISTGYTFVLYLLSQKKYITEENNNQLSKVTQVLVSIFLGVVVFVGICAEINRYFDFLYQAKAFEDFEEERNYLINTSIEYIGNIIILAFSVIYFTIMSFLNIHKIKSKSLGIVSIIGLFGAIFISQTAGLYILGDLRDFYLESYENQYHNVSIGNVLVRYVLFASVALGIISFWKHAKQEFMAPINRNLIFFAELFTFLLILVFLSNELITWLALSGYVNIFKLGLSILWGVYSLIFIYLGILKRKKHLRIWAISLFAITLVKLFLYDISHLNTISKIVVFISLGILLLLASFLYNKFKDKIIDDEKNN